MMTPFSTGSVCCPNCVYWNGERRLDGFSHRIFVDLTAVGSCALRPGWTNCTTTVTCSKFERHPIVKP